jgi:hypothetical protein
MQWKSYKYANQSTLWPIPRAIFSIFFIHSLFQKIVNRQIDMSNYRNWAASSTATALVIVLLVSSGLERALSKVVDPYVILILTVILLFLQTILVSQAQKEINHAEQDPQGLGNHQCTAGNYVWLAIGALLWVSIIFGSLLPEV